MGLLVEYGANLYDAILEIWFVTHFCGQRIRDNKLSYLAILLVFTGQCLVTLYANESLILSVAVPWVIIFLYTLTLKNTHFIKKLLSPTLFLLFLVLLNTLTIYLTMTVLKTDLETLWFVSSLNRYIYLIIAKIVLTVVVVLVNKTFDINNRFLFTDLLLYLVSPLVTIVVMYMFMEMSLVYDLSSYIALIIGVVIAMISINIIMVVMFQRTMQNTSAKHELELLNSRSELEEKRYSELGNMYRELQITRHDLKDHLIYIDDLIAQKRYDEAEQYIFDRRQELDSTRRIQHTGNRILDYIINSKLAVAEDVSFIITGELKELKGVDDLDIAALFGNILDNAIEGSSGASEKCIRLEFSVTANYQNIMCQNSIPAPVLEKNPNLKTSKTDKLKHGYGVRSMRRIVAKYNGMIEFYENDGSFCVHVALPF